jgi:EAL domain-containing protein (putative c-di-GMP-specific phosphodiesterase class I)
MFSTDFSNHLNFRNDSNFIPFYQPIIKTISREIYGYEVLGRYKSLEENATHSLGYFFHNSEVSLTEKVQIDRIVREKAVKYLKSIGSDTKLFFNMMPNILHNLHKEEFLNPIRFHIIQLIEKYNVDKSKIIIEITEDEFQGKLDRLLNIISIFKEYGFKIAIDDVGAGFSNLERIGYIHPDIIKVDIKLMRESLNNNSFQQVLTAIAELSAKLGSDLLFEGIETEEELNLAFKMGATLLQGFYFSKAEETFKSKNQYASNLKQHIEKFSGLRFLELIDKERNITNLINSILENIQSIESQPNLPVTDRLKLEIERFPEEVYELFITDFNGYKITPIFFRKDFRWFIRDTLNNSNFAWKPYFIEHKAKTFHSKTKWSITPVYYDIEYQTKYQILCITIDEDKVLILKFKL